MTTDPPSGPDAVVDEVHRLRRALVAWQREAAEAAEAATGRIRSLEAAVAEERRRRERAEARLDAVLASTTYRAARRVGKVVDLVRHRLRRAVSDGGGGSS